jgi:hypothetical protein
MPALKSDLWGWLPGAKRPFVERSTPSGLLADRSLCAGGDHAAMTIVRSEHRAQFTIIPNAILRDELGL